MPSKVKVLVVEDEIFVRMNISEHLSEAGFEVIEAGDADEAIRIIENTGGIRLVFTDIDMPGSIDGLKLAAAVADRWPPIRIIITSGHRLVEITDIPDGSVFFSKPYQPHHIEGAIEELLKSA